MQLLHALNWRYAVRKFNDTKLPETLINTLLEATRLSASSYGLQPYKLCITDSRSLREKLLAHSYGQGKALESSHLVIFAAETDIGDHTVDRYAEELCRQRQVEAITIQGYVAHMKSSLASKSVDARKQWAREQAYIALGTFLTSAAILGIDTCPMTGFDAQGFDHVLGLKHRGLESVAISAIGERSEEDHTSTETKVRRPREDFIVDLPF